MLVAYIDILLPPINGFLTVPPPHDYFFSQRSLNFNFLVLISKRTKYFFVMNRFINRDQRLSLEMLDADDR